MKFRLKKEKKSALCNQDLLDLGWIETQFLNCFEKDNYFVALEYFHECNIPIIRIISKDPSKIDWLIDQENFKIITPCPTKEHFEIITSVL